MSLLGRADVRIRATRGCTWRGIFGLRNATKQAGTRSGGWKIQPARIERYHVRGDRRRRVSGRWSLRFTAWAPETTINHYVHAPEGILEAAEREGAARTRVPAGSVDVSERKDAIENWRRRRARGAREKRAWEALPDQIRLAAIKMIDGHPQGG